MGKWQTKEQLVELLTALVEHPSMTNSEGEVAIAEYVHKQLSDLPYFKEHPEHVTLHPLSDGRRFVTALAKSKADVQDTIILISHFDVVEVDDYGSWKSLAFRPKELTEEFYNNKQLVPEQVKKDMENGEWFFGRGTMDMKAGLTLQMSMLEKACNGEFDGNVLLVTVPDEEANSAGMIGAVPVLLELAKKYNLSYRACLNSEPSFARYPGDANPYVYTGSIGKALPGFFCFGKETHVGEPFAGLNAAYMAAEVSRSLELNTDFCENIDGETTPPPTALMQRDLKEEYSVQIPHSANVMYNVMMMERTMEEMTALLLNSAKKAATSIEEKFIQSARSFASMQSSYEPTEFNVKVLTYDELLAYAKKKHGEEEIERRLNYVTSHRGDLGDRDFTVKLVQNLASLCRELAPCIVLYYSPPYYPAVSSRNDDYIKRMSQWAMDYTKENYAIDLKNQHYFAGLSDLSFVRLEESEDSLSPLIGNMPMFDRGYNLPVKELRELNIPVMNLGPFGRDAHQWTERLEMEFSFEKLPDILERTITEMLK
ncbi:M20/M25/M40 family metallo-hydrolase [Bacillus tianshenii]|nr:M20/M25/M40 family metallo-hydrolase [Bacillus tianshenii]